MSIGVYQSAASLTALERWQDAVTQNITSSQVTGFKRRTVQMNGVEAGEVLFDSTSRLDRGDGRPAIFPDLSYALAFSKGEAQPTRRELDVALSSDGFFTVRMPDGSTGYTRAGQMRITTDRTLIASQGLEVLDSFGNPIQLPPGSAPIEIDDKGNILQGEAALGRLGVVRFDDTSVLIPSSGGLFVAPADVEPEQMDQPGVLQGHLEASNVQPLQEMVSLVSIGRAYEANQKIIQNRDQMLQRTLDALT